MRTVSRSLTYGRTMTNNIEVGNPRIDRARHETDGLRTARHREGRTSVEAKMVRRGGARTVRLDQRRSAAIRNGEPFDVRDLEFMPD